MICKGLVLREQYTIKPLCVGSWGPVQGILGGLSPYLSGKQRRGLVHQQNPRLEICSGGAGGGGVVPNRVLMAVLIKQSRS